MAFALVISVDIDDTLIRSFNSKLLATSQATDRVRRGQPTHRIGSPPVPSR